MRNIRVVLDTNVLISALHFGGNPYKILVLAIRENVDMYISPFILGELELVLREKFLWSSTNIQKAISKLRNISILVAPNQRIDVIRGKDSDNRILECALEAKADYLISGDTKHILPLGQYKGVKILSPSEFLKQHLVV
ncbi:MAG: putative toxin-antitoxin system toxin component, PIN family [candidate division Zixibacteria bacterium]|nr:putative toxin-antitoxin system toxin component, PIN family [candidate division Zixibacteria bacterium]